MGYFGNFFRLGGAGGAPIAKAAKVSGAANGALYTLTRLLGSSSTLALVSGSTNSNLSLSGSSISASSALIGASQKAIVSETLGDLMVQYPVTLTGDGTAPPTRLMNVASAMRGPGLETGNQSNGTDTAFNSETWHYNESGTSLSAVSVVTPSWRADTDGNGTEVAMTGAVTIFGSIEYPAGTRTQMTWSSATSYAQPAGINGVSDMATIATAIPDGAMFGIHIYGVVASGVKWPLAQMVGSGLFQTGGKVDRYETGASGSISNLSMSGSPANIGGVSGYGYRPIGVLANMATNQMRAVSLVVIGDSIVSGAGDSGFDGRNNRSWAGRAAGKRKVPFVHFGVSGSTAQASAASGKFAYRLDALKKLNPTDVWLMYGTNDLGNRTLAQVQADVLTLANAIANAIPGVRIGTNTLLPRHVSAGADGGETVGRQIIPTSGAFVAGSGSLRAQYNAWVRTVPSPFTYMIETADALDVNASNVFTRDGGYWATGEPGARTYLDTAYTGQVTASPTTTSVPTNVGKASTSNYFASYASGYAIFADGNLRAIGSNASGTLTFSTALPSAPAAGDAVTLQQLRMRATADMVHPATTDNTTGAEFGGIFVMREVGAAKIQALGG